MTITQSGGNDRTRLLVPLSHLALKDTGRPRSIAWSEEGQALVVTERTIHILVRLLHAAIDVREWEH